jgi:serine/threonine protein kinase
MSLLPGARLGVFEIVALVGVGAMGEVYRARDTRLGRDVAQGPCSIGQMRTHCRLHLPSADC